MDFQKLFDKKCETNDQLQRKLTDYCSLYMDNRSVDQRLCDFKKMMWANLSQKKIFKDNVWTVNYRIGPIEATTEGFDESVCVDQCKSELLRKLTFFWTGNNNGSNLATRNQVDATTQIDLALLTGTGETRENDQESGPENHATAAKNEPIDNNEIKRENSVDDCPLDGGSTAPAADKTAVEQNEKKIEVADVDQGTSENHDSMPSEESAALVSQCPSKSSLQPNGTGPLAKNFESKSNDYIPEINTIDVSPQSDVVKSENNESDAVSKQPIGNEKKKAQKSLKPCEDDHIQKNSIVHNAKRLDKTITGPTITEPEKPVEDESYETLFETMIDLLDKLSENTLPAISDCLVSLLIAANDTHASLFNLIVEIIVQKAIDVYDDCPILAKLCVEIARKILVDESAEDRKVVAKRFKHRLENVCVMTIWGVEGREPRRADFETHVRSLKTCRFLGHLFVLNEKRLNMYFFVIQVIDTFMKSSDAQSLEYTCAFLMVAGSKLKKIRWSKTKLSVAKVYAVLEKCRTQGRTPDNAVLSGQTVSILDELLLLRERKWKPE